MIEIITDFGSFEKNTGFRQLYFLHGKFCCFNRWNLIFLDATFRLPHNFTHYIQEYAKIYLSENSSNPQ